MIPAATGQPNACFSDQVAALSRCGRGSRADSALRRHRGCDSAILNNERQIGMWFLPSEVRRSFFTTPRTRNHWFYPTSGQRAWTASELKINHEQIGLVHTPGHNRGAAMLVLDKRVQFGLGLGSIVKEVEFAGPAEPGKCCATKATKYCSMRAGDETGWLWLALILWLRHLRAAPAKAYRPLAEFPKTGAWDVHPSLVCSAVARSHRIARLCCSRKLGSSVTEVCRRGMGLLLVTGGTDLEPEDATDTASMPLLIPARVSAR